VDRREMKRDEIGSERLSPSLAHITTTHAEKKWENEKLMRTPHYGDSMAYPNSPL
jgi:hypothetical protein